MAIFNEILSGRYNRALQKIFAIKGSPPVRQLAGEISPQYQFGVGVENRFMEAWNLFGSAVQVPFVAGQVVDWQLRNPPASNIVAVVERLKLQKSTTDAPPFFTIISQDTNKAAYGAAVGIRCLDNRPVRAGVNTLGSTCQVSTAQNVAATGGIFGALSMQAFVVYDFILTDDTEILLLPGDSLLVTTGDAGNLYVSVQWRERVLEESERT